MKSKKISSAAFDLKDDGYTHTRIRKSVLELAKVKAKAENRSVTNFIETLVLSHDKGTNNRGKISTKAQKRAN